MNKIEPRTIQQLIVNADTPVRTNRVEHYLIPAYQRGYRWTTLHVEALLEDLDNFDLINKLSDLWEVYNKSWSKFNKSLSDFWKVMKDIKKLDSFDKTCKEIIDAWYDDIEKIFYSDDNLENLKLNYGFEGNDVF